MQVALPRVLEHPQAKPSVMNRGDIAHANAESELGKEIEKKKKTVNQLSESQKPKVSRDNRDGRKKKDDGERRGRCKSQSEKVIITDESGDKHEFSHIDIKI